MHKTIYGIEFDPAKFITEEERRNLGKFANSTGAVKLYNAYPMAIFAYESKEERDFAVDIFLAHGYDIRPVDMIPNEETYKN